MSSRSPAPTIAEEWDTYETKVLSPSCPVVQRPETRRAFYAGASAMFHALTEGVVELPDDKQIPRMAEYVREFDEFLVALLSAAGETTPAAPPGSSSSRR